MSSLHRLQNIGQSCRTLLEVTLQKENANNILIIEKQIYNYEMSYTSKPKHMTFCISDVNSVNLSSGRTESPFVAAVSNLSNNLPTAATPVLPNDPQRQTS